ncbi:motility protein A [Micavibrio aeruginosavorus]|uniref:Flagellar motor rotation protein MotA n=1 Tax=Micavibrio aeruginosavorus EPB TaxID=349215 RepID=M4VWE4_9BACT|nr:MotA/TolQ/ExbB proton channel family protein [Micavibrio aeruginosavorus]AGH97499.1 Flagellar motor rotation protein MotA [Micavibrio aeruginosavorus EPB]
MTSDASQLRAAQSSDDSSGATGGPDVVLSITAPRRKLDLATVVGVTSALALIAGGIAIGQSNASFFNLPSILIVVLGTVAATSISFTGEELRKSIGVMGNSLFRRVWKPSTMAKQLMDLAMIARKRGLLALAGAESELKKDKFLQSAVQLVTDGYNADDIDRVLSQEIDALVERHRRSANILRRGSEIAPAMGLIGTLIGLVQMLADLDNPDAIGPAMAVALLTTFYGAVLGMVLLAPLAAKLERNSNDEATIKTMVALAMTSIARQDNPRRLEMLLNSELPPAERIKYFD